MEIITVNVGHGALSVVRHNGEAILVDSRVSPADNGMVARVKELMGVVLNGHHVKGLIFTGFEDDPCDAACAAMILQTYRPDWVMHPRFYKETEEARLVFSLIKQEERARIASARPLAKASMRLEQQSRRLFGGLSDHFEFELFSPHMKDMSGSAGCSLVLKLTGRGLGGFSYLITGNTGADRWETLSALFGSALKADVLAAPHHGSMQGMHPVSLAQISPNTILISAGTEPEAMGIYQRVARNVFSTTMQGGVSLLTQQKNGDLATTMIPTDRPN